MAATRYLGLAALAACACLAVAAAQSKPWFCHGLDCPEYKVLRTTDSYEVREYARGKWASTIVEGYLYSASQLQGFQRLFKYISGENDANTKINMTSPVVTKVAHGDGPFCKSNFTISFFVPFADQENTPQPTNPDVYLHSTPRATFYVSQFGGFLVDDFTLSSKASALVQKLKEDGEEYDNDLVFTAGYDPPFRVTGRHNEIWLLQRSDAEPGQAASFWSAMASELRTLSSSMLS